ncbi:MAG: hypothetical protein IEMM0001_1643 [bacterium]|nr:MAG: hypothetical protein IEMM0001_1643 [bacterium]
MPGNMVLTYYSNSVPYTVTLKVWREFRCMTQGQLAKQAGISQGQVALIECGKREGKVSVLKGLANALNVDLDDLV